MVHPTSGVSVDVRNKDFSSKQLPQVGVPVANVLGGCLRLNLLGRNVASMDGVELLVKIVGQRFQWKTSEVQGERLDMVNSAVAEGLTRVLTQRVHGMTTT